MKYYLIHKPFQVLSQFSPEGEKLTLKDVFNVPSDVYPVGRLDYDSEGLLILTNDKRLNHRLLHPGQQHQREYWVQVEGKINAEAVSRLERGVEISVNRKKWLTKPCRAEIFVENPEVAERDPPIRFRKNIPTSWIKMILHEGKNRQVRKMTASVGFPTLRLLRVRIEGLTLAGLAPGEMREMKEKEIYKLLKLKA